MRDYRSFLCNGGDSSGYDLPKMNRVALRLGTECVVKALSLIADPSWTYHHQLVSAYVNLEKTRFKCHQVLLKSRKINISRTYFRLPSQPSSIPCNPCLIWILHHALKSFATLFRSTPGFLFLDPT